MVLARVVATMEVEVPMGDLIIMVIQVAMLQAITIVEPVILTAIVLVTSQELDTS